MLCLRDFVLGNERMSLAVVTQGEDQRGGVGDEQDQYLRARLLLLRVCWGPRHWPLNAVGSVRHDHRVCLHLPFIALGV